MCTEPGEEWLGQIGGRASAIASSALYDPFCLSSYVQGYSYNTVCSSERVETT